MSWIDVSWIVMATACLTLGAIHLLIWSKQPSDKAHLTFSIAAGLVVVMGVFELLMMHSGTARQYATLLRWGHVPVAALVLALVLFVRLHLGVGRAWLGHLAWALRAIALVPNFTMGANENFREITSLVQIESWGGARFMTPVGVPSPWMLLTQVSNYLVIAFFLDAAFTAWRDRETPSRAKAIRICTSMALFILMAGCWQVAIVVGKVHLPMALMPMFAGVLLVMSHELAGDVARAAQLTRELSAVEDTLWQSEQRTEDAVQAAGLGLWEWDVVRQELWLSPRASELVGMRSGESFDQVRFLENVEADDRAALDAAMDSALATGGPYRVEYRIIRADGLTRWLLARGQGEKDADGRTIRLRGVLADATERKLANERLRIVVESAPAAMLVVDLDGRIRFANRRTEEVFGLTGEQLAGVSVDDLVPGCYRIAHENDRRAHARKPPAHIMGIGRDLNGLRRSGERFPVEVVLNPIGLDGADATLVSVTDISERKQMEREAAVQRDELAHLARVALLAELSGSLAHELNQPLTSILSNAQAALRFMAHEPPDMDEVRESLSNIVDSDKRAGEVIRRLRAMLRKEPARFERIDANDVVHDVLRIIRSDLLHRNVEIRLDLQDVPSIEGDAIQLQQVLLNLIVNGTDAMHALPGRYELTVRTRAATDGGVELSVSDLGPGIPADDLERIFTPFVTSKKDGMGLGLPVCRTIIESHRGRLWATNNNEGGASLHFWLPALVNPRDQHVVADDDSDIEESSKQTYAG